MRIIIEATIAGEVRPGVLTDKGDGEIVAVFSDRTVADGRALGRITFLQPVAAGELGRIHAAGFNVGPADSIHCEWAR